MTSLRLKGADYSGKMDLSSPLNFNNKNCLKIEFNPLRKKWVKMVRWAQKLPENI